MEMERTTNLAMHKLGQERVAGDQIAISIRNELARLARQIAEVRELQQSHLGIFWRAYARDLLADVEERYGLSERHLMADVFRRALDPAELKRH